MSKNDLELRHFCGLQGFGSSPHDVCPKCEFERLVALDVPQDIAMEAGWLRCLLNPSLFPPTILSQTQKEYEELESKYGKEIP